jgi:D-beta-D-heptose 7-phosphate kinase/D-beta-D-heptose 1-phosphate adenosyltransferase
MYGMKIIINGCFDLLHDGHIHLIHKALEYSYTGSVLVLINSDKSVKELKGEGRPKEEVILRGHKVEEAIGEWCQKHLEYPKTKVQIFNSEEELEKVIDEFEPDMIIKGDDRPDTREIIGSGKWPILILPRLKDKNGQEISTTRKINGKG